MAVEAFLNLKVSICIMQVATASLVNIKVVNNFIDVNFVTRCAFINFLATLKYPNNMFLTVRNYIRVCMSSFMSNSNNRFSRFNFNLFIVALL